MTDPVKLQYELLMGGMDAECPAPKTSSILSAHAGFMGNRKRLIGLMCMPPYLYFWTNHLVAFRAEASYSLVGKHFPIQEDIADMPDYGEKLTKRLDGLIQFLREHGELPVWEWSENIGPINFLASLGMGQFDSGMQAMLASLVVLNWTTFETLAADLWVACVNARPRLGFSALDVETLASDTPERAVEKRNKRLQFPVWLLERWDYNLKDHMGELLKEMGKWDFANRYDVSKAYKKIFGKQGQCLEGLFDDDSLRHLVATRNIIVHKAGRADAEFTALVQGHPELSKIKEGEVIDLNGAVCGGLIAAGYRCGVQLLKFVDDWMVANPK